VIQTEAALLFESDSTTSSTADADAVIDKSHAAFDYHKQNGGRSFALAGGDSDGHG
jgi:hypothetical protein